MGDQRLQRGGDIGGHRPVSFGVGDGFRITLAAVAASSTVNSVPGRPAYRRAAARACAAQHELVLGAAHHGDCCSTGDDSRDVLRLTHLEGQRRGWMREQWSMPMKLPTQRVATANQALVDALMEVVGQDLIRIDRGDGQPLDEEDIRDVLTQQIDAMPKRLTEMKLMSACDHTSVIDHRRRA